MEQKDIQALPELIRKRPNFYNTLLGGRYEGMPAREEMPTEFKAPRELIEIARKIFPDPEYGTREMVTTTVVNAKGELVSTPIRKGPKIDPKVISFEIANTGRGNEAKMRLGILAMYLREIARGGSLRLDSLHTHSHPTTRTDWHSSCSGGDFDIIFDCGKRQSMGILDYVALKLGDQPDPAVMKKVPRYSLYLKSKDFKEPGVSLTQLKYGYRSWLPILGVLVPYRLAVAKFLEENGIINYEALFNDDFRKTGELIFKKVQGDDLHELGPFVKTNDANLYVPANVADTRRDLRVTFSRKRFGGAILPKSLLTRLRKPHSK